MKERLIHNGLIVVMWMNIGMAFVMLAAANLDSANSGQFFLDALINFGAAFICRLALRRKAD
jgi:hypothetical protein